jgi:hypothetical protein
MLYLTHRGYNNNASRTIVVDGGENVRMRDEMWNGHFLWIDGEKVPVVTDDALPEKTHVTDAETLAAGEFASDIYFIPLRAKGIPVLYWEYLDYSQIGSADMQAFGGKQMFWNSDGGRFMWTMKQENYCFQFELKCEPRLVLRTPQLCARISNIKNAPLMHMRSPFPDSPYYKGGGAESYDSSAFYTGWPGHTGPGPEHL